MARFAFLMMMCRWLRHYNDTTTTISSWLRSPAQVLPFALGGDDSPAACIAKTFHSLEVGYTRRQFSLDYSLLDFVSLSVLLFPRCAFHVVLHQSNG